MLMSNTSNCLDFNEPLKVHKSPKLLPKIISLFKLNTFKKLFGIKTPLNYSANKTYNLDSSCEESTSAKKDNKNYKCNFKKIHWIQYIRNINTIHFMDNEILHKVVPT